MPLFSTFWYAHRHFESIFGHGNQKESNQRDKKEL